MSDLISRKALLEAVKEMQKQRNGCEPQSGSIINLIKNSPAIEQGEAVYQIFVKGKGWFDVEEYDLDYVDASYTRALYTTPQPAPSADDVRDAERYRYLRDCGHGFDLSVREETEEGEIWVTGYPPDELNKAIDQAIAVKEGE